MNGNDEIRFTAKELLVEVRDDVRAINSKLDQKADRDRVHALANELAALRLEHTQVAGEVQQHTVVVHDHSDRLDVVERVWDRVAGGLKVAAGSFGLFSGLIVAFFAYALSSGPP